MADDAPPAFDAGRLIADLRAGKPEAFEQAYKNTFGNTLGRMVLASFMADCGVGRPFRALGLSDAELRYAVGVHDAALDLAVKAGFDQASVIVALATDQLEGSDENEPAFNYTPPLGDDSY